MTPDDPASRVGALHPGPWRVVHHPHPYRGSGFWSWISILDSTSRVVMDLAGPDADDRRLRTAEWLVALANAQLAGAASDGHADPLLEPLREIQRMAAADIAAGEGYGDPGHWPCQVEAIAHAAIAKATGRSAHGPDSRTLR